MITLQNLSVGQLRKVVAIKEQIERLQAQLDSIAGDGGSSSAPSAGRPTTKRRRVMSASARARIGAAQRARWAKKRGGASSTPAVSTENPAKKTGRRKVSAATRARLAAVAKARWAKVRASGKSAL